MDPTNFLKAQVPGYADLSQPECEAIANFSLLWSAMEGRLFHEGAGPVLLIDAATRTVKSGLVSPSAHTGSLSYFRDRYFREGAFTYNFEQLHFRPRDKRELVEAVLNGTDTSAEGEMAALLLIVYRLRNNLFHGTKWAYGIQGQLGNFTQGSAVLMLVLQAHPLM